MNFRTETGKGEVKIELWSLLCFCLNPSTTGCSQGWSLGAVHEAIDRSQTWQKLIGTNVINALLLSVWGFVQSEVSEHCLVWFRLGHS